MEAECQICGEDFTVPFGYDPTEICNECAQLEYVRLKEMEKDFKELLVILNL